MAFLLFKEMSQPPIVSIFLSVSLTCSTLCFRGKNGIVMTWTSYKVWNIRIGHLYIAHPWCFVLTCQSADLMGIKCTQHGLRGFLVAPLLKGLIWTIVLCAASKICLV